MKHVPGIWVPPHIVERIKDAQDQTLEGRMLALETMQLLREKYQVPGIHLYPLAWTDTVPWLLERTVAPREIADMQGAVAALVRANRVGQGGHLAPRAASSRRFSASRFAAAVGVCSLLALSGAPRPQPAGFGTLAVAGSVSAGSEAGVQGTRPMQSLVEELGRPGARVYELPQADMAVVMIVDASLDV